MRKLFLLCSLLLVLINCGGGDGASTNSPQNQAAVEITKQILQAGLTVDPISLINGTWIMYHIIPNSVSGSYFVIPTDTRILAFNNGQMSVVGNPNYNKFDANKDKFQAGPLINFGDSSARIDNEKKSCDAAGKQFHQTPVPDGTIIYSHFFDLGVAYEIIQENNVKNLKVTSTGKDFVTCCEIEATTCSSVDFTGPTMQTVSKFLIKAATPDGFILEGYDSAGNPNENDLLSFVQK